MSDMLLNQDALKFHTMGRPGKLKIEATKPLSSQRDLSLAYSPGVAEPCRIIHKNPEEAYNLTAKGNLVAVISNGTAILGLGNLGALASKPVMEGKAVLFKKFSDIDGFDIEIDTDNIDEFINAVKYLSPTFGGINLEDIKAPDCFIIEEKLKEAMDIPVFHDDQHGTAIISAAGLINALELCKKKLDSVKIVVNGAGSAAIACLNLLIKMGAKKENIILCDSKGVIFENRAEGMNEWKTAYATKNPARTLEEALIGTDIFLGLSVKNAMTQTMVASMAKNPIIFALANPDPEILPKSVKAIRDDAIIATGRSDYPNQVNNVLGFPYIFRGALDVQASKINDEMKIAAVYAIANLAKQDVPEEVGLAYNRSDLKFGKDYIIPVPFDHRLIVEVSSAVAKAAIDSGVAKKQNLNFQTYKNQLKSRLNITESILSCEFAKVREAQRSIIFVQGESLKAIKSAIAFIQEGFGTPILIGDLDKIKKTYQANDLNKNYFDKIKCVNDEGNHLDTAIKLIQANQAAGIITGFESYYINSFKTLVHSNALPKNKELFALTVLTHHNKTLFICDTAINKNPTSEQLAHFAIKASQKAKELGHIPRVAFISYQNLSDNPLIQKAMTLLKSQNCDFEFDGDLTIDAALDYRFLKQRHPETPLTDAANILIMPTLESAHVGSKLLAQTGHTKIGPLLIGSDLPIQIVSPESKISEITTLAALTSYQASK